MPVIAAPVRIVYPGSFSNSVLRIGTEIKSGKVKVIQRNALPQNDRARLGILENTSGLEIVNIIGNKDGGIKTVDVSLTSVAAVTMALVEMAKQGLQKPSVYNDGFVIQLNF